MSLVAKCIREAKIMEAALTTQYTATAVRTILVKFTVTNYSGGASTLRIYIVPSGLTAADDNMIIQDKSLAAGECYTFPELVGQILNAGDFIQTDPLAGATFNLRISGHEIT